MPFLIAGGDVPGGKSLDMLAQPVDILPTLAELAEVAVEPEEPLQGKSFARAVLETRPNHRSLTVTGGFVLPGEDGVCPKEAVTPWTTDGRWGMTPVGANGAAELYDLHADPFAAVDVAASNATVVADLRARLAEHLRAHGADQALTACWTGDAR